MKMVPYDAKKLNRYYKSCSNQEILEQFIDSDLDCVRIDDYPHKNAAICRNSLALSIKRFGFNITAIRRGNDVFLVKNKIANSASSVTKGGDSFEEH